MVFISRGRGRGGNRGRGRGVGEVAFESRASHGQGVGRDSRQVENILSFEHSLSEFVNIRSPCKNTNLVISKLFIVLKQFVQCDLSM